MRVTNAMKTLLRQLGIDPTASTPPNLGSETDAAALTGSAFAQINKAQTDIGASADTASASGSLFARAKYNKDAVDAVAARALVLETNLRDVQTITLTSVVATDAVVVNGTTFTAVASGATGDQFNVGVDDAATATNLAAKIHALAGVSATSDAAVVTVTADAPGVGVVISTDDTTIAIASLSAANFAGVLHTILAQLYAFDARITAVEGT